MNQPRTPEQRAFDYHEAADTTWGGLLNEIEFASEIEFVAQDALHYHYGQHGQLYARLQMEGQPTFAELAQTWIMATKRIQELKSLMRDPANQPPRKLLHEDDES